MEKITIDDFKANTKEWLIDKLHNMIISDAIKTISNIHDELHKPQYPKTYEECCKVLGYEPNELNCYIGDILESFGKLLICRDVYWEIASKEMGLGKCWKPDWTDCKDKFCITIFKNKPIFDESQYISRVLAFPTEEMRDVFFENFKELINETKELL